MKVTVGSSKLRPHSTLVLIVSVSFFMCLIDANLPETHEASLVVSRHRRVERCVLPVWRISCSRIKRYIALFLRLPLIHRQPATFIFFFFSVISNSCSTSASPAKNKRTVGINLRRRSSALLPPPSRTYHFFGIDRQQPIVYFLLNVIDELVDHVVCANRYFLLIDFLFQILRYTHVKMIYDGYKDFTML